MAKKKKIIKSYQPGFSPVASLIFIIIIAIIVGGGLYYLTTRLADDNNTNSFNTNKNTNEAITNFDDCAAAGYPVMESYPRRCTADGQTFTEIINNSDVILGGDEDEHGCIGSAGYIWCESSQKCIRPWEEDCPANDSIEEPS